MTNQITINLISFSDDELCTSLQIQNKIEVNEFKKYLMQQFSQLHESEFTLFKEGDPLEDEVELKQNDEIVILSEIQSEEMTNIHETTTMKREEVQKEETPLDEEEMMIVYEHLNQEDKDDILIIAEMGFDLTTAVTMYCMCRGNKDNAVNRLLMGDVNMDLRVITDFMIKRYPYAIQQVRPGLLHRKTSFHNSSSRESNLSMEDILLRALLNQGRINGLRGSFEDFLGGDSDDE